MGCFIKSSKLSAEIISYFSNRPSDFFVHSDMRSE